MDIDCKTWYPMDRLRADVAAELDEKAEHGHDDYIVQKGDTLSKIAKAHGLKWQEIAAINGISFPYTIKPGQALYLAEQEKPWMVSELLKSGSRGDDVKELQTRLNALGFDCGAADGIYGVNTRAAVKAFQIKKGLTADGIAGKDTITAIGGVWIE